MVASSCCCVLVSAALLFIVVLVHQSVQVVLRYESASYASPHDAVALSHQRAAEVDAPKPKFCNFDGLVCCHSATPVQFPGSVEEVQAVVRGAAARGSRVRVTGAGHSMSALICDPSLDRDGSATPQILVSLDRMQRVLSVDRIAAERQSNVPDLNSDSPLDVTTAYVTVEAGLRLIELNRALRHLGLGLKNMGLIQEQSVAGLMATGVHGTGNRLRSIPSVIQSMDVVLANGTVATWSAAQAPTEELFRHARLHLGLFGVVVSATLAVTDLYDLQRHNSVRRLDDVLAEMYDNQRTFRHYQFWWVPGTAYALENAMDMVEVPREVEPGSVGPVVVCDVFRRLVKGELSLGTRPCKFVKRTDSASRLSSEPLAPPTPLTPVYKALQVFKTDMTFDIAVRLSTFFPRLGPWMLRLIPYLEPESEHLVGWAPDMLTFPGINFHSVRYTELEYFIPMRNAMKAIRWFVEFATDAADDCPINSIDPIRTVAGDDVPLSPLYGWHATQESGSDLSGGGVAISFVVVQRENVFRRCSVIVETMLQSFGGRPHWGKRHPLVQSYEDVVELFGKAHVNKYRAAVLAVDPAGMFRTNGLNQLLGLP